MDSCWPSKRLRMAASATEQLLPVPQEAVVEGVFPGTHAVQLFEFELAVGQHRVDGPARRCRIIHGVNGNDGDIQAQAVYDAGSEDMPAGLPRVHAVVRPGAAVFDRRPELMYDVLGEGGTADLVIHDAQFVLCAGQPQDGADEVVPRAAVQPSEAQDELSLIHI